MSNLVAANLYRLRRNKGIYIAAGVTLLHALLLSLICWQRYMSRSGYIFRGHGYGHYPLEGLEFFLRAAPVPFLILAFLLSSYLGTENQETVRNKIAIGHTRAAVYMAELLACIIIVLFLDILFLLAAGVLSLWPAARLWYWQIQEEPWLFPSCIAVDLLCKIAYAAVIKLVSAAAGGKRKTTAVMMLLLILEYIFLAKVSSSLFFIGHGDIHVLSAWEKGTLVWGFLVMDTLPLGQYFQVIQLDTPNLWRMPLLSLAVIAVSTAAGLAVFRKKDLN